MNLERNDYIGFAFLFAAFIYLYQADFIMSMLWLILAKACFIHADIRRLLDK